MALCLATRLITGTLHSHEMQLGWVMQCFCVFVKELKSRDHSGSTSHRLHQLKIVWSGCYRSTERVWSLASMKTLARRHVPVIRAVCITCSLMPRHSPTGLLIISSLMGATWILKFTRMVSGDISVEFLRNSQCSEWVNPREVCFLDMKYLD